MIVRTGRELLEWLNTLNGDELDLELAVGGFEECKVEIGTDWTNGWIEINPVEEDDEDPDYNTHSVPGFGNISL